jgi:TRAP-type C4-dicarboxylate transport system substrate-binding protein
VLETGHATVTVFAAVSKVWFDGLSKDHQALIVKAGQEATTHIYQWTLDFNDAQRKVWLQNGGEVQALSPADKEALMKLMLPIGNEVASRKPAEKQLFDLLMKSVAATA